MTFLPRTRKDGKRRSPRPTRRTNPGHSLIPIRSSAIGNEAKPVCIRLQGRRGLLGRNGGKIAAARIGMIRSDLGRALTGDLKGLWRYRVGDYRIVASIEDDRFVVLVVTVGHRREVYDVYD
jgi:mRNA-degrading endonuclease RelE of RelBE toxin-antitoxin system